MAYRRWPIRSIVRERDLTNAIENISIAKQQLPIVLARLTILPATSNKNTWTKRMTGLRNTIMKLTHLQFLEYEEAEAVGKSTDPVTPQDLLKIYKALARSGIITETQ